jgi:two-component system response regulator HydG
MMRKHRQKKLLSNLKMEFVLMIVERAIILGKGSLITPASLPQGLQLFHIEALLPDKIKSIDELTKEYAEKVVEMFGGNKSKAAELLGVSRTSLWRILKEE